MPRCEYCKHYKVQYAPYIKKNVMGCELKKRNKSCKGNFKEEMKDGSN